MARRPSVRPSVCPSVNFSCPQPLWRHAWADFVHFAHEHHPWWGLDARALDFWFDAALLTYAALQCWQPSHWVRAHCEDTHGSISFMLVLNITHGEVLMHMHWIFDLMLHCWLMLFFSADRLLLPYLWETGTEVKPIPSELWQGHDLCYKHSENNILTYALQNGLPAAVLYGSSSCCSNADHYISLDYDLICTEFQMQTSRKSSGAFNLLLCCDLSLLLQGCCSAGSPISWELWKIETWFAFETYSWC